MAEYLLLLAVIVGVLLIVRLQVGHVTVFEYERGLKFVHGHLRDELGAGRYRYLTRHTMIRKVDTRLIYAAVNGQEVLSKEGVAVKVSLSAAYRVVDARTAIMASDNYVSALYTELQQALRAAVSNADVDALLLNRADLGPQILAQCQGPAERLGLTLDSVAIRDLTLPGELKKIFAQVVKARQEGLASLERARGETAALRNLANAAQMVQRSPQLLQLRALQVAGQQPGTSLVIGMPPGTVPLPSNGGSAPENRESE